MRFPLLYLNQELKDSVSSGVVWMAKMTNFVIFCGKYFENLIAVPVPNKSVPAYKFTRKK